jgi:hypothetical protein
MDRLAELAGYAQSFPGMVDEDFLAAGFTPEEVSSYRSQTDPQRMTPEEISLMADRYGTLQEPNYNLGDLAVQGTQDILSNTFGMNPYNAGVLSRKFVGDPNSSGGGYGLGLLDLTGIGGLFAIDRGLDTAFRGSKTEDPVTMGLGALETILGVAEVVPVVGTAVKPLSKAVIRTVGEVFDSPFGAEVIGNLRAMRDLDVDFLRGRGDPALAQGVGADVPGRPPLTFDEVEAVMKAEAPAPQGIKAYQGSPHDFAAERLVRYPDGSTEYIVGSPDVLPDIPAGAEVLEDFPLGRMRMDKIGTGEGAQVYGHGMYVAEAEDVAKGYKDNISSQALDGAQAVLQKVGGDVDAAIADRVKSLSRFEERYSQGDIDESLYQFMKNLGRGQIEQLKQYKKQGYFSKGHMYEVNINTDPADFLDWNAPLSAQPQTVQDVLGKFGATSDEPGQVAFGRVGRETFPIKGDDGLWGAGGSTYEDSLKMVRGEKSRVKTVRSGDPAGRAAVMKDAGIPGIKYLDQVSRSDGAGTRNFVVFDEKLISIVKKYGIAGAATMLGVSALDVEQALADNLAPSDWEDLVAGPQ